MVDAVLAAFLRSASVLVLPLMVTYLGAKSLSTSTPSSRVGRSRRWPTVAFTSYPAPRYFPIVLALVGDSTMTSALPMPALVARGLAAFTAPFLGAAGAALGLPVLAGDLTARLDLVAMSPLCLLGSSNGQFGGCKKSAPPKPRKAAFSKCPNLNNLGAVDVPRIRLVPTSRRACGRAEPRPGPPRRAPWYRPTPHNERACRTVPAPAADPGCARPGRHPRAAGGCRHPGFGGRRSSRNT